MSRHTLVRDIDPDVRHIPNGTATDSWCFLDVARSNPRPATDSELATLPECGNCTRQIKAHEPPVNRPRCPICADVLGDGDDDVCPTCGHQLDQ